MGYKKVNKRTVLCIVNMKTCKEQRQVLQTDQPHLIENVFTLTPALTLTLTLKRNNVFGLTK